MQLVKIYTTFSLSAGLLILSCTGGSNESMHPAHPLPVTLADHLRASRYMQEYDSLMQLMHREMAAVEAGRDDRINFLKQMIPHHQGAVNMAEAILQYSTDRRITNLARGIITEQKNEIALMHTLIRQLEDENNTHFTHENTHEK